MQIKLIIISYKINGFVVVFQLPTLWNSIFSRFLWIEYVLATIIHSQHFTLTP